MPPKKEVPSVITLESLLENTKLYPKSEYQKACKLRGIPYEKSDTKDKLIGYLMTWLSKRLKK